MEDPIMKRSKGGPTSLDIISNLPDNVIESILTCLPLRDAIRTSVLSSTWKDKWVTLPHLVFTEDTLQGASVAPANEDAIKIISQILLQHTGPILKLKLCLVNLRTCPSIDHWLSFLSRNGIEDLTLAIRNLQPHKLHLSLFSCRNLRQLTLFNCIVRPPPPTFTGFKKLTKIVLKRVLCSATSLEYIIAKTPLLMELYLIEMLDLHPLNIYSPNLKFLYFSAKTIFLRIKYAPRLLTLGLYIDQHSGVVLDRDVRSSNLLDFLGFLPRTIKRLEMNTYTSQVLKVDNTLKILPSIFFSDLRFIGLKSFSFEDMESVACALCLINNSPNLNTIQIDMQTPRKAPADVEQILTLMRANLGLSVNVKKLLFVTVTSMGGTKPEMEFIKFILADSPVLRKVTIKANRSYPTYDGSKTLKELVSFSRASSVAQIIYSD